MIPTTTEPACPGAVDASSPARSDRPLAVERHTFADLDPATWGRLATANPWATPFSSWAFHRAWWDAYAANAHEQTLVVRDGEALVGIAPLMHRHEVEPSDAATHTSMRHGHDLPLTPVDPTAKAVFFGASYHADYATLLAAPHDLPAVAGAVAAHLASPAAPDPDHPMPWDVVDLRRLRALDPTAPALADAFRRQAGSDEWHVTLEREDVCPVAALPHGGTFDDYLGTLGKKARHEIRRKIRRAEAAGEVRFDEAEDPLAGLDAFIDLHQRRWGAEGLFPDTQGGAQSRVFIRRLFELLGPDGPLRLAFLTVGGHRIAAGLTFETPDTTFYYNAGVDPDARELSPGVLLVAQIVQRALARGARRLDFLRGDEGYKYEWGARDEPIQRLLVRRSRG